MFLGPIIKIIFVRRKRNLDETRFASLKLNYKLEEKKRSGVPFRNWREPLRVLQSAIELYVVQWRIDLTLQPIVSGLHRNALVFPEISKRD